ncbi:MAG: hypothetical protein HOQ24_08060 [Mycobacteriaceae bacterium]|nr:hypothetical protein [Mycobacteriaceae bacterium]
MTTSDESAAGERDASGAREQEFAEMIGELRALAGAVLERVEPALRRAAQDGDRSASCPGCNWCPLCAAAALAHGEHHDLVAAVAGHAVTVVTVLREALAGAPVDPVDPSP